MVFIWSDPAGNTCKAYNHEIKLSINILVHTWISLAKINMSVIRQHSHSISIVAKHYDKDQNHHDGDAADNAGNHDCS